MVLVIAKSDIPMWCGIQDRTSRDRTKTVRETKAEAVAFVVCQIIGLDNGHASADYIVADGTDKTKYGRLAPNLPAPSTIRNNKRLRRMEDGSFKAEEKPAALNGHRERYRSPCPQGNREPSRSGR